MCVLWCEHFATTAQKADFVAMTANAVIDGICSHSKSFTLTVFVFKNAFAVKATKSAFKISDITAGECVVERSHRSMGALVPHSWIREKQSSYDSALIQ